MTWRPADPLTHRARASPDRTAVVDAGTGGGLTYADLDGAVDALAGRLTAFGVGRGDHLGTLFDTSVDAVRTVHAAMRLGAVLVPLNVRLADPEIERQAARADLDALVCDAERAATAARTVEAPAVCLGDTDETPWIREYDPGPVDPVARELTDPALLMFTSGTTGDPKAVTLTGANLLSSAVASAFRLGVDPGDRWSIPLSIYHMGGLAPVVRSTLYGSAVVVHDGFDADRTAAEMHDCEATGVSLVPTMLRRLLDAGDVPDAVRFVLLGGAPTPESLAERCRDRGIPVYPTYGMTETASQIATATPQEAFEHPGTVGRPLLGTDVTVIDDRGRPLDPGEVGELVVSGPTVTPGYYGDPDATERAFCEHGLRTGDVGYRDGSGRLYVLDRREDRIVTGGENVHPGEVVDVLRSHPDVRDAAVVGLDDPEWGERVAALVVPDSPVDADDLRSFCRERLAAYKCPTTWRVADSLPRTASGTVDREAVRERLRDEA